MHVVNLREFYQSGCNSPLKGLSRESGRYSVMEQVTRRICESLVKGMAGEEILKEADEMLSKAYQKENLFAFDWQASVYKKDDLLILKRFLHWMDTDVEFLASNLPLTVDITADTKVSLYIDLLVRYQNGAVGAIIIRQGKADKSFGGKTVHTSINTDLFCMAAKMGLEGEYPGILISIVYLRNEADSDGIITGFHIGNTRKSNVFTLSFSSFYEETGFQYDDFSALILSVLNTKVEPKCYLCLEKPVCKKQRRLSFDVPTKEPASEPYVMPEFTASQKRVVDHLDGPLLVCAGPGAGKTAVITGRVKCLLEKGIDPEFILVITFTSEAAGELRKRCASFCTAGEMPEICTLHALGYKILRKNENRIGRVRIMTRMEQMKIISSLLEKTSSLRNFSYTTREDFLMKVANKLDGYMKCSDIQEFMRKEHLGEDFILFAKRFFSVIRKQGYITFDEQITMCCTLFKEYPEVLSALQKRYRYVMVDEYQDIDADQAQFIYALAEKGNIVAVGDDDQAIYGFRGGSNQYMLDFSKVFENAKKEILSENYRSTQTLVDAAQKLIKTNRNRIPKEIYATRESASAPKIISGGARELGGIVSDCIKKGYMYKDIAVLSSKNVTLEAISGQLEFPHFLEKNYLIEDRFFLIVYDVLTLYFVGMNDIPFTSLSVSFNVTPKPGKNGYAARLAEGYPDVWNGERVPAGSDPVLNMYRVLEKAFSLLGKGIQASMFIDAIAAYLGIENTVSAEAVENVLTKNHIYTCFDLLNVMNYMVSFQDDTRIYADYGNSVELTTSHDAKGKEYPVVILLDDFSINGEESIRLYYVAITRAKDELFVLKGDNSTLLEQVR